MVDPFSSLRIAAFAFVNHFVQTEVGKKFIESIVGKLGQKTVEAGLSQINDLKRKIIEKLTGNADAQTAIADAEMGDQEAVHTVAAHLQLAMNQDRAFAAEIKQIAEQIINIGKVDAQNQQINYGSQNLQVINPQAPTVLAGENANITFNYGKD